MKVLGIIGSNNKNSITGQYSERVIEEAKKHISIDACEFIYLHSVDVKMCLGCGQCFRKGICPLDVKDDMTLIKLKMLEADIILLATPVYLLQVSGIMKNFLDRISYWTHLMRLHNKLGIIIVSTSNSGCEPTGDYLENLFYWFGVRVIFKSYYISVKYHNTSPDLLNRTIKSEIQKQLENVNLDERFNDRLENIFQMLKEQFAKLNKKELLNMDHSEIRYWVDSGMLDQNSFREFVHKVTADNIENERICR